MSTPTDKPVDPERDTRKEEFLRRYGLPIGHPDRPRMEWPVRLVWVRLPRGATAECTSPDCYSRSNPKDYKFDSQPIPCWTPRETDPSRSGPIEIRKWMCPFCRDTLNVVLHEE